MSNETKQDVFGKMKWELIRNLANTIDQNGGLRPLEDATKVGTNYAKRYATALPDDMPSIPKVVGEYIKGLKQRYPKRQLIKAFPMVYAAYNSDVRNWVLENSDTFALAWLLGVWRVEETGEAVKLESEE